ncbi:MAG: glutamate--cysteine ligase, partial [Lysobacteraceae bacterium]
MSGPSHIKDAPIENRQALVDYLASGGRPKDQWRIGTEHEKFGFHLDTLRPPTWEGDNGIRAMLEGLTR